MKIELIQRKRSILIPVLIGGVVGAGLALLFAPKSGPDIRKDMKRLALSTGEQVASAVDKGKDVLKAGKGAITAAVESGNIEYYEGKDKFEHAV